MANVSASQFQELLLYVPRFLPRPAGSSGAPEPADPTTIEVSRAALAELKKASIPNSVKFTIDQLLADDTYDRVADLVVEDGGGYVNRGNMTRADLERGATGARLQPPNTTFGRLWNSVANVPSSVGSAARLSMWEQLGYKRTDIIRADVHTSVQATTAATGDVKGSFANVGAAITALARATDHSADKALAFQQAIELRMDECEAAVRQLDASIEAIDTTSETLFNQWALEISYLNDEKLQQDDRAKLAATRATYADMLAKIRKRRETIQPTLTKLRDSVLWLRHQLNADALTDWIAAKGMDLQAQTAALNQTMVTAMADINKFLEESGKAPIAGH